MHIGLLTGGGDCPGLNAVIRAVTLALAGDSARVTGIERGFWGLLHGASRPLEPAAVQGILAEGGTILGTTTAAILSRTLTAPTDRPSSEACRRPFRRQVHGFASGYSA